MLQTRILLYTRAISNNNHDTNNTEALTPGLGISPLTVGLSLATAVVHTFVEGAFLYLEAASAKTSLMHYAIVCFNGRFGWVPFTDLLASGAPLNYDQIERSFCCTKYSLDFGFTNDTIETFTKLICNLPWKE